METYVGEADDSRIRTAILRELDRGGQISSSQPGAEHPHRAQAAGKAGTRGAHRRGPWPDERTTTRKIMIDFAEGKVDILLSTTIIESGLDFPNANTLIVDRAGAIRPVATLPATRSGPAGPRAAPMPLPFHAPGAA